jgi:GWxTD domain-containing protein
MKIIFFLLLFITTSLYAQRRMEPPPQLLYSDIIYLPGSDSTIVYITYRIPFNRLIFEKTDSGYSAAFRLSYEVFNDSSFIQRQIVENKVEADNFGITESDTSYFQGFISFALTAGEYKLISHFTDLKNNREIRLKDGNIKLRTNSKFFQPLTISAFEKCSSSGFVLANYEGSIPFDGQEYKLFVPVKNPDSLFTIRIKQRGNIISEQPAKMNISGNASLKMCGEMVVLDVIQKNESIAYIEVEPGLKFMEGELEIDILNDKSQIVHTSRLNVKWINKPRSLIRREIAVNLLKIIEDEKEIRHLVKSEDADFDSVFFDFWKKYDPTPSSTFNELMNEYYSRADYAAQNFRDIAGKNGMETDRGKIYIRFGKPLKIDRVSNEKGKIVEIWFYTAEKKITFIDEKGTGEFNLLKG